MANPVGVIDISDDEDTDRYSTSGQSQFRSSVGAASAVVTLPRAADAGVAIAARSAQTTSAVGLVGNGVGHPSINDTIESFKSSQGNFGDGSIKRNEGNDDVDADNDDHNDDDNDFEGGSHYGRSAAAGAGSGAGAAASAGVKRSRSVKLTDAQRSIRDVAKAAEKAAKQAAKDAEKRSANALRHVERAEKGAYALQEIALAMTADLHASEVGAAIAKCMADYNPRLKVLDPIHSPVPNSLHWRRGIVVEYGAGAGAGAMPSSLRVDDAVIHFHSPTVEPFVAVLFHGKDYVELVASKRYAGMLEYIKGLDALLPIGSRLTFIIVGLRHAMKLYMDRYRRRAEKGDLQGMLSLSQDSINSLNTHLYTATEVEIKTYEGVSDVAEYVVRCTQAIGEMPYRMQPSALACVTKVRVGANSDHKGDDGKKTTTGTWWAMLQMIPGVSEKKASKITDHYPTYRSLMEAYRNPAIPVPQKEVLLENVMGAGQPRLTKMSKDIYTFFTTTDPMQLIGQGS